VVPVGVVSAIRFGEFNIGFRRDAPMHRFLLASVLSLAALLFLAPAQLRADGTSLDTFVFSENILGIGPVTLTWQLPSQLPTTAFPITSTDQGFQVQNVTATLTAAGTSFDVPGGDTFNFYANGSTFGVQFTDALFLALAGVNQMFCGPTSAPVFIAGTYAGYDPNFLNAAGLPDCAVLTITTPEPSSILMYFVGFLALAGVLAIRKIQG
jgi:hypothetical protein